LNATLHLIKPYGFFLNNKHLKRSGLDYWKYLKLIEHDCYEEFINTIPKNTQVYYITRYGTKIPNHLTFHMDIPTYFVFGKESSGIPKQILNHNKVHTIRIPTSINIRSLNLSNCVAIIGYEYVKQNKYKGLCQNEPHKPLID
jgi:tRNA (cytidine/uridine-2'-O-)-methyltransferase